MAMDRTAGHTLLEMTIVVTVLAIIASIAVPVVTVSEHQKLGLAASAVADAFRFSREESRRTGIVHGVSVDLANNQLRVFRLDESANPNLKIFDVYQPVSKQLYNIELNAGPYRGVTLDSIGGQMVGTCDDPGNIAFDSVGVVRCIEPIATRIQNADIEISMGTLPLTVAIDDYTGRISIQ